MRLDARTLGFLIILIAVIAGGIFLQNRGDEASTTPDAQATSEIIDLFAGVDADSVTRLSIVNNQAPVVTVADDEATEVARTTVYTNTDGTWSLDTEASNDVTDEPIVSEDVRSAVVSLLNVRSSDQFESEELEQFGLTEPSYIITLDVGDDSYTLTIGDQNFSGQSYYVQRNDETTVYLTTNVSGINGVTAISTTPPYVPLPTPTPQRALSIPGPVFATFNAANIISLSMVDNSTGDELVLNRDETTDEWLVVSAPEDTEGRDTDTTTASIIISEFGSTQGLDTLPAGDDLSVYGLDDPIYTLQATDFSGASFTLQIGGEDISGTRYYVHVDEFEQVVTVTKANIDLLLSFIANPPLMPLPEVTPEVTPEAEATAES